MEWNFVVASHYKLYTLILIRHDENSILFINAMKLIFSFICDSLHLDVSLLKINRTDEYIDKFTINSGEASN